MSPDEKLRRVAKLWNTTRWPCRADLLRSIRGVSGEMLANEPLAWREQGDNTLVACLFHELPEDLKARLVLAFDGRTLSFEQYARTLRLLKDRAPVLVG